MPSWGRGLQWGRQVGSSFPPQQGQKQGQVHVVIMVVLHCVLLEPLPKM